MFSMQRSALLLGAVVGAALVANPASAERADPKLVPFHATYAGTYSALFSPPNVIITGTGGDGRASHLGRFELTDRIVVSLVRGPVAGCPVPGTNEFFTATLTAANGDTITLEGPGHGCQTGPTTVATEDAVTVTGGTGRFEGATGSITVNSAVDQANRTVVITFAGALSTPGSST